MTDVRIYQGDCLVRLAELGDESVHCVITSPPYYGLRDYQVEPSIWGGDAKCKHDWSMDGAMPEAAPALVGNYCQKCGAWRGALGLEPTVGMYLEHMVEIFREVRRVLRKDGTLWLNMGDSYVSAPPGNKGKFNPETDKDGVYKRRGNRQLGHGEDIDAIYTKGKWREGSARADGKLRNDGVSRRNRDGVGGSAGLKQKDLIGMPWRLALALQADGWWLRQDIIWCLSGGTHLYARTATAEGPMMLKDLVRLKPESVELWNGTKWTRVEAWRRRVERGQPIELVLWSGERIGCTGDHVWPTERGDVRTDKLRVGDVLKTARLPSGGRSPGWLSDDAFWFAGAYLADGSRSDSTIQISGHAARRPGRVERLQRLAEHYGGSARVYTQGNNQSVHIDCPALSAVLQVLVGGNTAYDKHLTSMAWQYWDASLARLMEGYLEGDGSEDCGRIRLGLCRNYALERDLRCMAARLGATLTLNSRTSKNQSGKEFPSFNGEWRWMRSGHFNERERAEIVEIRSSRGRQFWDVTVADEPHLFALASGVLTHNCKPNPMPESTTDRCTKSHEYFFMLSKSARYYYDQEAIAEPVAITSVVRISSDSLGNETRDMKNFARSKPLINDGFINTFSTEPSKAATTPRHDGERWNENNGRGFMPAEARAPSKSGNKARKDRHEHGGVVDHPSGQGFGVPWEGWTRNKRSVWTVPVEPFPGSHFAVFPPALIRPAILAGCPQRCCAECGAPMVRQTVPTESYAKHLGKGYTDHDADLSAGRMQNRGKNRQNRMIVQSGITSKQTVTTGWAPTCKHNAAMVPGVVLDPFGGSGTVAAEASILDRDSVLIELSPVYVGMIEARLGRPGFLAPTVKIMRPSVPRFIPESSDNEQGRRRRSNDQAVGG